jgi:predicted dehydrogenase
LGIYPLSLASFLLGPVVEAQAQAQHARTGVDAHTLFMLRHASGGISQGLCSFQTPTPASATVLGREGRIELHAPFYRAERVTLHRTGAEPQTLHLPHVGAGYSHQVDEVHRCLRVGALESVVMPLDESVALMGWLDAMRAQIGVRYPGE